MKLKNGVLRPGVILSVLENGNIRAEAPGLFSADDLELLPPIMPFFGLHANTYSEPQIGDEVWILNFTDNPQQLFWFRKDNIKNNSDIISEQNVEILCNRESGLGWASIYFSDGSGWIIRNNDSKIQLRKDGSILLDTGLPHRVIDINDSNISIGSVGESEHPAAYGDTVRRALTKIQVVLEAIQSLTMSNYMTMPIGMAIGTLPTDISNLLSQIESPNVTID